MAASGGRWDVSFEDNDPRFKPDWTKLPRDVLLDKIKGVVFGQAIGDAIGLATEFMNKREAQAYYGKHGPSGYDVIVQDFHRSRWQKGDWTDDTDQMILILASLVFTKGKPVPQDLARRLVLWMQKGFPDLGDIGGMGIGMTTHRTLTQPQFVSQPHETARNVWEASGRYLAPNGAVMRTSILGVANFGDLKKVVAQTREMCHVTHADPRCLASCVAVTTAIALMLQGKYNVGKKKEVEALIDHACEVAESVAFDEKDGSSFEELQRHINVKKLKDLHLDSAKAIGYTYKALGSGIHGLRYGEDFKDTIIKLIMEAGDADSNASVCGALLGCKLGYNKLPADLLNGLVHKKWLDGWVEKFLQMMGLDESEEMSEKQDKDKANAEKASNAAQHDEDTSWKETADEDPVASNDQVSTEQSGSELVPDSTVEEPMEIQPASESEIKPGSGKEEEMARDRETMPGSDAGTDNVPQLPADGKVEEGGDVPKMSQQDEIARDGETTSGSGAGTDTVSQLPAEEKVDEHGDVPMEEPEKKDTDSAQTDDNA